MLSRSYLASTGVPQTNKWQLLFPRVVICSQTQNNGWNTNVSHKLSEPCRQGTALVWVPKVNYIICQSLTGVFDMSWFGALSNCFIVCKRRKKGAEWFYTADDGIESTREEMYQNRTLLLRDFSVIEWVWAKPKRGVWGFFPNNQNRRAGVPLTAGQGAAVLRNCGTL